MKILLTLRVTLTITPNPSSEVRWGLHRSPSPVTACCLYSLGLYSLLFTHSSYAHARSTDVHVSHTHQHLSLRSATSFSCSLALPSLGTPKVLVLVYTHYWFPSSPSKKHTHDGRFTSGSHWTVTSSFIHARVARRMPTLLLQPLPLPPPPPPPPLPSVSRPSLHGSSAMAPS